jgi:hypothetical protein
MDLTIPYTLYPLALSHSIAWALILVALVGGVMLGVLRGQGRGWLSGLGAGLAGVIGLLALSMVASMIITFFVHDL